jgi:hypothetical protein
MKKGDNNDDDDDDDKIMHLLLCNFLNIYFTYSSLLFT